MAYARTDIVESAEFLMQLLEQEKEGKRYQKLRALYFVKTREIKAINQIAVVVGCHPTSLHTWLKAYRKGGLEAYLYDRNDRFIDIPEWLIDRLVEEFQDAQFLPPIREIQSWILKDLGVSITYGQLQRLLRFKVLPKQEISRTLLGFQKASKVSIGKISHLEIREEIHERFQKWKNERGFPNDSQALNQLLGEFFKLRDTHEVSPFQLPGKTLIESLAQGTLVPKVPHHIPNLLIQNRLAERLGVDDSTLSRERGKRTFPGWTKQHDPDGVGWLWVPELKKYRPLRTQEEIRAILLAPNKNRYASLKSC